MIPYILVTIVTIFMAAGIRSCKENHSAGAAPSLTMPYKGQTFPQRQQTLNFLLLLGIFLVLFLLSALRYEVGNDYTRYREFFHLIPLKQVVPTEFGFNASVLLIQALFGGEAALPIFTVYSFFTVLFMVLALKEQSRDFLFSFFLFMSLSFYFQSLNTVRYYLAWAVALYSMKFVLKKEYLKFILIVLITATVHKSVLLVIPAYLLARAPLKRNHYILITPVAASGILLRSFYLKLIIRLYPSYEGTSYLAGGTSVMNIIRIAAVFILSLLCYKTAVKGDAQMEFCFNLNYFALLLYTCGSFIPELSRIGYYLNSVHIFLIPGLIMGVKDKRLSKLLRIGVVAAGVLYFAAFLYLARAPLVRIVPYHTWVL